MSTGSQPRFGKHRPASREVAETTLVPQRRLTNVVSMQTSRPKGRQSSKTNNDTCWPAHLYVLPSTYELRVRVAAKVWKTQRCGDNRSQGRMGVRGSAGGSPVRSLHGWPAKGVSPVVCHTRRKTKVLPQRSNAGVSLGEHGRRQP